MRYGNNPEEWFYLEVGANAQANIRTAAQKICDGCEHREACLTYAIDNNIWHGVWGAATPLERRKIAREREK